MPGVPSYRGCDACHKQKKKCDQAKPRCARCARLNISCEGTGQLRYKFKDQSFTAGKKSPGSCSVFSSSSFDSGSRSQLSRRSQSKSKSRSPPAFIICNEATSRLSAFIDLLAERDPGYDLSCYGPWFRDLPRRLGTNEALDAAVDAMACTYPYVRTRQIPKNSLSKYVDALHALSKCLGDPVKAKDPETLCAIYIILICQTWTGRDGDQKTTHGEGLAHLLDITSSKPSLDEFETSLRDTLCIPVILESLWNPRIRNSAWFNKMKVQAYGPPPPITDDRSQILTLDMRNLIKLHDFLRHPTTHLEELKFSYLRTRQELPALRAALFAADAAVEKGGDEMMTPRMLAKMQLQYQILVALMLMTALIMNGLLQALGVEDDHLREEAVSMAKLAIHIAKGASKYRPLGASFIPLGLVPAWAANDDQELKKEIVRTLESYKSDFTPAASRGWYLIAVWLKSEFELVRSGLPSSTGLEQDRDTWHTVHRGGEQGALLLTGSTKPWFD